MATAVASIPPAQPDDGSGDRDLSTDRLNHARAAWLTDLLLKYEVAPSARDSSTLKVEKDSEDGDEEDRAAERLLGAEIQSDESALIRFNVPKAFLEYVTTLPTRASETIDLLCRLQLAPEEVEFILPGQKPQQVLLAAMHALHAALVEEQDERADSIQRKILQIEEPDELQVSSGFGAALRRFAKGSSAGEPAVPPPVVLPQLRIERDEASPYFRTGIAGLRRALADTPDYMPDSATLSAFADSAQFFREFLTTEDEAIQRYRDRLFTNDNGFKVSDFSPRSHEFLKQYLHAEYPTLDDMPTGDRMLARALGARSKSKPGEGLRETIAATASALAARAVILDLYSSVMPDGHSLTRVSERTFYVQADIVGPEQAKKNLKKWADVNIPVLDLLESTDALASYYGLPKSPAWAVAAALVNDGIVSGNIPHKYLLRNSHQSFYFDARVVGAALAAENLKTYCQDRFKTLDDVVLEKTLATALGASYSLTSMVKAIVARGCLSAEIPRGHPYARGQRRSFYLDADCMSPEQLLRNRRQFLRYTFPDPNDIHSLAPSIQGICDMMSVPNARELARWACTHDTYSNRMPSDSRIVIRTHLNYYLEPEFFGERAARRNRRLCLAELGHDLGNLGKIPSEQRAHLFPDTAGLLEFARRAVQQRVVDPVLRTPGPLRGQRDFEFNFIHDPYVVGERRAYWNLKRWVEEVGFSCAADTNRSVQSLSRLLSILPHGGEKREIRPTGSEIFAELERRGWTKRAK